MTSTLLPTIGIVHGDAVVPRQLGVGERRHTHQLGHLLSRGQAHLPASAEVPLREQAKSVGVRQRRRGHLEQWVGQRRVELPHGPSGEYLTPVSLKNLLHWIFSRGTGSRSRWPVQVVVGGRLLEQRHAGDGAQDRSAGGVVDIPDGVARSGDAVAEAVRGHRELDRDERAPCGVRRLVVLEVDVRALSRFPGTPSPSVSVPTMAGRNWWITIHW